MTSRSARGVRVLIADDHPSVSENLRYLINGEADLECVGVVNDGARCVQACAGLAPDVLIVDNEMPHVDGITITRALARRQPDLRVVMCTLDGDVWPIACAFGATGCVPKDAPYEALVQTLRNAVADASITV
jgi:DNA-binding NarL/FixJ family response regulator